MTITDETTTFLIFVFMGMVFSVIFDFFRAIRKLKKVNNKTIYIQDIIYFIIVGILLLIIIINYMNTELRFYLIIAILLGIVIYIGVVGNKILNLIIKLFKFTNEVVEFLFLPLIAFIKLFDKQIIIFKKYVIKCCKKISYMINLNHIKEKFKISKQKRIV